MIPSMSGSDAKAGAFDKCPCDSERVVVWRFQVVTVFDRFHDRFASTFVPAFSLNFSPRSANLAAACPSPFDCLS